MTVEESLTIDYLVKRCQKTANEHGWKITWRNIYKYLLLVHSEVSEATEALRDKDKNHFGEELAGCLIRLFHLIGDLNIPIEKYLQSEMDRNDDRPFRHGRKAF